MSTDELNRAVDGIRRARDRLDAALIEAEDAKRDLDAAEALATAELKILKVRGEVNIELLDRLYWDERGMKPGHIAAAIGEDAGYLHRSITPRVEPVGCFQCGEPTTVSFHSRAAWEQGRHRGNGLCNRCEDMGFDR